MNFLTAIIIIYDSTNLQESRNADTLWLELKKWDAANYLMGASIGGDVIEKVSRTRCTRGSSSFQDIRVEICELILKINRPARTAW